MIKKDTFGFFRKNFFPIYYHEFKKFMPLSALFFIISFNYALLRAHKDTFILKMGGSPLIYATKLWGVLPFFIALNIIYGYISQRTSRITRFSIITGYFLIYFAIFAFLILPNRKVLQFAGFEETMQAWIPLKSFDGLWKVIRYWPVTLFYIHAEAWGTFMLSILFFTFANEIVNTRQSGRFYPFLSVAANIGTILAGLFAMKVFVSPSIETSVSIVVFNGVILILLYTYFATLVFKVPEKYEVEVNKAKKKKAKLSIVQTFKILLKSDYLLRIGLIVFSYAACISLYEAIYKDLLKEVAPDHMLYYSGLQLVYVGAVAIIFSLFLGAPAMKMGWRFMGSISPSMLMVNCILFLFVLFMGERFSFIAKGLGITVGFLGLFVGLSGIALIKGSKYTFFDPFKENAYIPLSREEKMLGKASIENLSRWGKAGGSFFITVILPLFVEKGANAVKPFRLAIAFIIFALIVNWLVAVQDLTSRFYTLVEKKKKSAPETVKRV